MPPKVFISYRHTQKKWVRDELVQTLQTCGCEPLVDDNWFRAGEYLRDEIPHWQNQADVHVLVWSPDYFQSRFCNDEMDRARASGRKVVPVLLETVGIPDWAGELIRPDLRTPVVDGYKDWRLLLEACEAPIWKKAVDQTAEYLSRGQSINVVSSDRHIWEPLLQRVKIKLNRRWGEFDLHDPSAIRRDRFVRKLLGACGVLVKDVPAPPDDLVALEDGLAGKADRSTLTLKHFDYIHRLTGYDLNFFATLRYLIMSSRKLVLLAHSQVEIESILPKDHPFSHLDVKTVDLRCK